MPSWCESVERETAASGTSLSVVLPYGDEIVRPTEDVDPAARGAWR